MEEFVAQLRSSIWLEQKKQLQGLWHILPQVCHVNGDEVMVGDDAAALRTADGYLLFAAEGVYPPLLKTDPYLAGRACVLANVNDIYAMGGRPLAILDVLFCHSADQADLVLRGVHDNARRYGVPVVGGHLTQDPACSALSVFIVGRARSLLSSFNAMAGDELIAVVGTQGRFFSGFKFWDCSSKWTDAQAVERLELLPRLAEDGLADAAKDVSMAGIIGTILMLLEGSGTGAEIYLDKVPRPSYCELKEWLLTFPSFGFVLSLRPASVAKVCEVFEKAGLMCGAFGRVTAERRVFFVDREGVRSLFWDFSESPLIGLEPSEAKINPQPRARFEMIK
jgi:AIR synthase-related protein